LPYKHGAWNSEEEGRQNTEKLKNIEYKIENVMQNNIKNMHIYITENIE
jgi:hypothetical protein